MELKGRFKVVEVLKKTATQPFQNVEVGDVICISLPIKGAWSASKGSYVVVFNIVNESKNVAQGVYGTRLGSILNKNVKIEEI